MKNILILLCLVAGCVCSVQAAPSSNVAWTSETVALVKSGDGQRGATLAARCGSCHGEDGVSRSPGNPSLAGQLAPYTFKQLMDYKDGKRQNGIMRALSGNLSDQDMADIAAFYAGLPVADAGKQEVTEAAERLVKRGDGQRLIPACQGCHGRSGQGNVTGGVGLAVMPVLVGQHPAYIAQTMRDYQSGRRANDVYSRMRSIAAALTDEEIEALSLYYGTLGSK